MTWTPDDIERLKALRDKVHSGSYIARVEQRQEYTNALTEADPLSRIEEIQREVEKLKRRWEALREWFPRKNARGQRGGKFQGNWRTAAAFLEKVRELEAPHD